MADHEETEERGDEPEDEGRRTGNADRLAAEPDQQEEDERPEERANARIAARHAEMHALSLHGPPTTQRRSGKEGREVVGPRLGFATQKIHRAGGAFVHPTR